jgi:rod shape-determining protein MreD
MRDITRISIGLILAVIMYTLLESISFSTVLIFNIFNLVVIYFAMEKGETSGAILGMVCGMIQDSFSAGVFGVAGISKTITGFLAGFVAKRIDIVLFSRNFIFIFFLSGMELIIWAFFYVFIFSERINTGQGLIFLQPMGTALLGSISFKLIRYLHELKNSKSHEK